MRYSAISAPRFSRGPGVRLDYTTNDGSPIRQAVTQFRKNRLPHPEEQASHIPLRRMRTLLHPAGAAAGAVELPDHTAACAGAQHAGPSVRKPRAPAMDAKTTQQAHVSLRVSAGTAYTDGSGREGKPKSRSSPDVSGPS